MAELLISVIVPVYNVEKYLNNCVESIINQTYKNLEIILVDDGSTDNCPQICDEWAKKDDRIKVIHKKTVVQLLHVMMDWALPQETILPLWTVMITFLLICMRN